MNNPAIIGKIGWFFSDIFAMTYRGLLRYISMPQLIVFSTIQPILFLVLFAFVFGGAIDVPGASYLNFLVPGILVQVALFGSIQTGIGLSEDIGKGLVDRFRSLPVSPIAVLAGRTLSDLIRNIFVMLLMFSVADFMGFDPSASPLQIIFALSIILLFGFAFSWLSMVIGLTVKNSETAQVAGFLWVFPLVFASSIFVPIETMPGWLEAFAKINPITVTVNAARALILDTPIGENLWQSLSWSAGIIVVFAIFALWRYRKLT